MNISVEEVKTTEQNLEKLQFGRIDGYFTENYIVCDYYAETRKYGDIVRNPIPIVTKDYFVLFSHQFVAAHNAVVESFWKRIGEIRDSLTVSLRPKYLDYAKRTLIK